ncbi:Bbp19 family protein [Enterobacter oligotrophicus]
MTDFDEEELRIQNERKKHDLEQREKDDIKFVMDSEQGRRVVWGLLEKGQVFGTCFNVEPNITAFNEGQRNLALVLLQRVMAHCPDQYLKMAAEASEQE